MIEIGAEIHLPESKCDRCGYVMDMATMVEDPSVNIPKIGDISLCMNCGFLSIFDENLRLRPPTDEEIIELVRDEKQWNQILEAEAILKKMARLHDVGFKHDL